MFCQLQVLYTTYFVNYSSIDYLFVNYKFYRLLIQ